MNSFASPELRRDAKRSLHTASYFASIRLAAAIRRVEELLSAQKFNSDQPRAPVGTPEGGRWIGQNTAKPSGDIPVDSIISIGGQALKETCERQLDSDIFQCRMVGLRSCYEQAYQRYAACLARRQIPPFNY